MSSSRVGLRSKTLLQKKKAKYRKEKELFKICALSTHVPGYIRMNFVIFP